MPGWKAVNTNRTLPLPNILTELQDLQLFRASSRPYPLVASEDALQVENLLIACAMSYGRLLGLVRPSSLPAEVQIII
jgi:hypothetical protein